MSTTERITRLERQVNGEEGCLKCRDELHLVAEDGSDYWSRNGGKCPMCGYAPPLLLRDTLPGAEPQREDERR